MPQRAPIAHPPLALTIGEPAGIGPEVSLQAWQLASQENLAPFFIIGDIEMLQRVARRFGGNAVEITDAAQTTQAFGDGLPVLNIPFTHPIEHGCPSAHTASGVIASIDKAVELTLNGAARAVITNPIQKSALKSAGFAHPGHTEYLATLAHGAGFEATPVMMLANKMLRSIPVTVHIALANVPSALSVERIVTVARIAHRDLKARFGIAAPRLAISGLNPHAGEEGAFGREDIETIKPAITQLVAEGIDAFGPLPADTMFHEEARAQYDVALCMYHDQALIPVKALGFHDGVNVTLGLPFVRTSPDHGTALDLAGTGTARPDSLIAALKLADKLSVKSQND